METENILKFLYKNNKKNNDNKKNVIFSVIRP